MKPLRMNALPEALRQQIISARKAERLSQKALGARIGLSQKHISEIENGKISPRFDTALEIFRALDLELVVIPRHLTNIVRTVMRSDDHDDRALYAPDKGDVGGRHD